MFGHERAEDSRSGWRRRACWHAWHVCSLTSGILYITGTVVRARALSRVGSLGQGLSPGQSAGPLPCCAQP